MVKRLKPKEVPFLLLAIIIFVAVAGKYHRFWLKGTYQKLVEVLHTTTKITKAQQTFSCAPDLVFIKTSNGNLCRPEASPSAWLHIFDSYPTVSTGKEIVYDFLDQGDIKSADMMIAGLQPFDRYEPIEMSFPPTWEEDPFNERYWRFMYYSLRETRHLLYAFKQTGQDKYQKLLVETVGSFLDEGAGKPHAWDDYHAVAFRSMTLLNTWWKLRQEGALPLDLSEKILKSLQVHGEFMLNEAHYEPLHNHGISQAAALLLLGVNFPDLLGSEKWKQVAQQRIKNSLDTIVDEDGALVENSPYYHFYALEKYWKIYEYIAQNKVGLDLASREKIKKMVSYATYILQPNLKVPIVGASLDRQIGNTGTFKEISKENPEFLYVLTQGRQGQKPKDLSKYYPTTGQTIMRSGWDKKTKFENKFADQTQVIFDVGPYRTNHSDLDALNINHFSNGQTMITDTGLYTYEAQNQLRNYFHGTSGHNTVIVDGQNQRTGSPVPGKFVQKDGYTIHSAQHTLYPQTVHQRSVALLGHDFVVVVDRLISAKDHDYEQQFHLFPQAKTEIKDGKLVADWGGDNQKLTIHQLIQGGEISVKDGLCSFEYEITVACPTVTTKTSSQNASFVTLLEIGSKSGLVSAGVSNDNLITVVTKKGVYKLSLSSAEVNFFTESKAATKPVAEYQMELAQSKTDWQLTGPGSEKFEVKVAADQSLVISPKQPDPNPEYAKRPSYVAEISGVDTYYSIDQKLNLNIPGNPAIKTFRIYEQEDFVPILGYHHVIDDDQKIVSPSLEMHVSDFEKQIDYLTNTSGCRWFTFGDIMENYVLKAEKVPQRACVINFDDGRKDHFTNGYRVFRKYGAVATFYIISQRVLNDNPVYLNLSELDELYRNGNEIGSHTVNAGNLMTYRYNQKELVYQLEESRKMLESQGYRVTMFAYPGGEQNQNIVNLTKKYYQAGRDIAKDNSWREPRPTTAGFGTEFVWHMHYFKPELLTPKQIENSIGYNSWWQFEEGYRIDNDPGQSIRPLSSYDPTPSSYGIVDLWDAGDRISNKFIVSRDDTYTIEVFGTVNAASLPVYAQENTVDIFVDGIKRPVGKTASAEKCTLYKNQYYCGYTVTAQLKKGAHTISVESKIKGVKVDKFKMFRSVSTQETYSVKITQYQKFDARPYPRQMEVSLNKSNYLIYLITNAFAKVFRVLAS
ncbi:hypothetical protein A2397_05740 [Candidatus Amesbacteria bacterium RIFOXYB1_FULL_44_23]|uniref:NodB homology domain-containing protein n=1 Tax=Candidatus Amesbacteria bacterium RIFOXYB1_FULL_44_23 TaxID=1797263 RepID=A0A1F4ZS74_9BACT|nr:MAG: hypothetical protein A2397_05740 [Candidatus Amesbacteria bacterium RIFOXYB1_FULL_44_23]